MPLCDMINLRWNPVEGGKKWKKEKKIINVIKKVKIRKKNRVKINTLIDRDKIGEKSEEEEEEGALGEKKKERKKERKKELWEKRKGLSLYIHPPSTIVA